MKITYVANSRIPTPRAHGIQIVKMCEVLSERGHEITLIVPRRFNHVKEDLYTYYGVKRIFKFVRLPTIDLIWFGRVGFKVQSFVFSLTASLYCLFFARGVIYSRDELFIFFATLINPHCYFEAHVNSYNWITRGVIYRSEKMVTISQGLKRFYIGKGLDIKKSIVAPSGVDVKTFDVEISQADARKKLGLPEDRFLLGYSGSFKTMDMEKGIECILGALKELDDPSILFVAIGGDVAHIAQYKEVAERMHVSEQVYFLKRVPSEVLALYHKACDVLLMPFPSISHYTDYMSPVKMFEYMATKRPIIASDLPSIREVLDDTNGFFCVPGNHHDLASKIVYVREHREEKDRIVSKAFSDVQNYTWDARMYKIFPNL